MRADGLTIELDPEDGGKVTRLRCERHERDWLHGPVASAEGGGGGFGADRSWGWDELFPTVLGTQRAPSPWPRDLRDHGELWGRPWTTADGTALGYEDPGGRYRFTRSLERLDGTLRARYTLCNTGSRPFPWMWSMHPILAVEPGDRLELVGVRSVAATYVRPGPREAEGRTLHWPVATVDGRRVRLDRVAPPDGATALKLYAGPRAGHTARLAGRACRLELTADVPFLGLYVNLGGWPGPGSGLHQLGIEPTTAPVDDLATAVDRGLERTCLPGAPIRWSVSLRID
jgi:hypothetical protein